MARRKRWEGPFKFTNGSDGKCVKCDAKWQYLISFGGYSVSVCRQHAIEGLTSREGKRTLSEAEHELSEIDAERLRLRNTHSMTWVPVRDRLPPVMQKVLAFDPNLPVIQSARHNGSFWDCEGLDFLSPSHWMPLPETPVSA
jgi:hypothetical protein